MSGPRIRGPLRRVVRAARKQGWTLAVRGSGHFALTAPETQETVVFSATASDGRAWKNIRAELRRRGVCC